MTDQEAPKPESGSQPAIEPAGFRAISGGPMRICLPSLAQAAYYIKIYIYINIYIDMPSSSDVKLKGVGIPTCEKVKI